MQTKHPLIILEGPDGAGKTTLAVYLIQKLRANYFHFNQHATFEEYINAMKPDGHVRVLDRSWLSERPYGTAFHGGRDRFGDDGRLALEQVAMALWRPEVVFCYPRVDKVLKAFNARRGDEMLQTEDQLIRVHELYYYEMELCTLPIVQYDYSIETNDELFKRLAL